MRKSLALASVALAVPVMLVAPLASAGAALGAPAHDHGHGKSVGWVSCDRATAKVTHKPPRHVLSCADHNSGLRRLTWSSWGKSAAMGAGTFYWNDCKPDCAAGTTRTSKATVELRQPKAQSGKTVFTKAIVSYKDQRGNMQVQTFESIPWQG